MIPAAPPPSAVASAVPRIEMMVVGRRRTLAGPRTVRLSAGSVRIGSRRCPVPAGTALAGLLAAHVKLTVTDIAGCDPTQQFVIKIGPDRNHGAAGWEYKVGHTASSFGAADPSGRIRGKQTTLLWYWCAKAGACARTLSVTAARKGAGVTFHVTAYDDNGHGIPAAGATLHIGNQTFTADAHGDVGFLALFGAHAQAYATDAGMIRSFPIGATP